MTAVKRSLAVLLVVVLALTMLESGADARRRRHRRHARQARTVDNLGVTIDFTDNEPVLPLGGGILFDDDPDTFGGTVSGLNKRCGNANVKVEVFHGTGEAVGETSATTDGAWHLVAEDPGSGAYFARATQFGKKVRRTRTKACATGVSDTMNFDDGNAGLA